MEQKSVILHFPKDIVDRPYISTIIRKHDVVVNILQASVTPESDGIIFAIMKGETQNLKSALTFLDQEGVIMSMPETNLVRDDDMCTSCGACVSHCMSDALVMEDDYKVVFKKDNCIACDLCIPACSYGSISSIFDHLNKEGTRNGENL